MPHLLDQIDLKAKWYSRRMRISVIGALLVVVGGGFLTVALWMTIAEQFSALIAHLVMAAVFIGAGLVVLSRRNAQPEPKIPTISDYLRADAAAGRYESSGKEFPALMEAFLFGVSTYSRVRNRRR